MVHRIDWRSAKDPRDVVHATADRLSAGELIVFPTETGYVTAAKASDAAAVERLQRTFTAASEPSFVLALPRTSDILKYVKSLSVVGRRLADRCWPGPVTLLFPSSNAGPAFEALPDAARRAVARSDDFALRIPAHASLQEALRFLAAPLVLGAAFHPEGESHPFGPPLDSIAAILDDGPPKFPGRPTVVRIRTSDFEVVETGVVTPGRLQRLANEMIVFVCSGNTCRSPMAEALTKRMLADQLNVDVEHLSDAGFTVVSAGVAAASGAPASDHARDIVRTYGADLDDHVAQRLTPQLAFAADRLIVMTREHQEIISRLWPSVASRLQRLGGDRDVIDPYGGSRDDYQQSAEAILERVRLLVADILGKRKSGSTEAPGRA
jgi:protein-tyrosine-phosphatase/tRNA A37 threonylcarbamoyladenosine synthetase subunit TsaC/SUA5/YrdC